MYSEYDYLYNPPTISIGGYFNVINVIIIILLIVCFYILINNFSISHFSNIPSKQNELDNDIINEINSLGIYQIVVIPEGSMVTMDFRMDRFRVFVSKFGVINGVIKPG